MDDLRFEALPRAQAFDALIDAIATSAPLPKVVAAAIDAGKGSWRRVLEGDVLARAMGALGSLASLDAEARDGAGAPFAVRLAELAERLAALRGATAWDDADEIATLAVLEGYAEALSSAGPDAERRTTRAILGRLGARLIAYVLDRELARHVGARARFRSVAALHAFRIAVEAHVRDVAARVIQGARARPAPAAPTAPVASIAAHLRALEAELRAEGAG